MAAAVAKPDRTAGEVVAVYVQPKEGYNLTGERILEHLKETVGERAALPKDIVILQTMPLTAVGKIFKPALHWDAIRRTYEKELAALQDMAESVLVTVGEDKVLGVLATIKIKPFEGNGREDLEKRISDILVSYNIRYRLEFI
jgi:fatty-acyl-CoA synthase